MMKKVLMTFASLLLMAAATVPARAQSSNTTTDVLNQAWTGRSGTSYGDWWDLTATSVAVYAGNSAGGNYAIQIRTTNNNSGIVTTTSGGTVASVTVTWNSSTANNRTLQVYGKNSAYSAASDLYGGNAGTLLGTIVKGTSTSLTIEGDYEYIGLRSASGAMYLDEIQIVWNVPATGGNTGGGSGSQTPTLWPSDAVVYDFEAAAAAGENPGNKNGSAVNGQAFYGWEQSGQPDKLRSDYKGYEFSMGSVLPRTCHVWRRSDRINGNVSTADGGLKCPSNKEMAIDSLTAGMMVVIIYDSTAAPAGSKQIIWAIGDGTTTVGLGHPRATATIGGVEAVPGVTPIRSGDTIIVTSVTPAENGTGYIVFKVKTNMVIKQIAVWEAPQPAVPQQYRLDSIPLDWQVKVGNAAPVHPTAYTEGNTTLGHLTITETDSVELIPPANVKPFVKSVTLVDNSAPAGPAFDHVAGTFEWTVGNESSATVSDSIQEAISATGVTVGSGLTNNGTTSYGETQMVKYQPQTSNAGVVAGVMVEYRIETVGGVKFTPTAIEYAAMKLGTDNVSYSWSYTLDGVESSIATVTQDDILRSNGNNSSTAQLMHGATLTATECDVFTLRFYVSGFPSTKQMGLGKVTISGTVNGVASGN